MNLFQNISKMRFLKKLGVSSDDNGILASTDLQTFGIANGNTVKIDHAAVADNDYAKFTANGLEGRSYSELLLDTGALDETAHDLLDHTGLTGCGPSVGLVKYLTPNIITAPNVAGGDTYVSSLIVTIPAGEFADLTHVELSNVILDTYTADGVATETRSLVVYDTVTPLTTDIASGVAMPNNVHEYMPIVNYKFLRLGTHLYGFSSAADQAITAAGTAGLQTTGMQDFGEPDFTKTITITMAHTLSAPSANAIIRVLAAEAKHCKRA